MAEKHISFPRRLAYLRRGERFNNGWTEASPRPRNWEDTYRSRWQHDKIVRSTHGVNCTGSCSWKIYVKDGIITSETQQTDYPSLGNNTPEYEPRGCPRGASFSWYTYSPLRVKYPYVRSELLTLWRQERQATGNPVQAWKNIVTNPEKKAAYQKVRGKGGLVRAPWEEVTELISAANIYTIQEYGPDRVFGFSPIPAMSQVSYAAGSRYLSLIGGSLISFYDWYADLPPASPQIWGEQTDVPESADWFQAKYFIIWGTNLPMTRTPDAHFMVEARYHGTKVVGVSPDYAEYIKFADQWLPAKAGTDAALAMAMTHVVLKEFYVDKQTPYFAEYVKKYTDLPCLVTLRPEGDSYVTDRFLHAADFDANVTHGDWKTVVWDTHRNGVAVPKGSLGFRYDSSNEWNLKPEDMNGMPVNPSLSVADFADDAVIVQFPYFGADKDQGELIRRGVPIKKVTSKDGETLFVTTVLDLMLAHCGVNRNFPGDYPKNYDDPLPYTPAWQESITGVKRELAIQVAREFAENAARTQGKSMIALGAGTNHWYHSDLIYRCIINLVTLTGCQGVNGGGWAHYVGQEKVRPLEGWATIAFGLDWNRPPRQMQGTSFFYFVTDQFRYEELETRTLGTPLGGRFQNMHPADINAMAVRLGWMPSYPQLQQNPLEVVRNARESGATTDAEVAQHVADGLQSGKYQFAIEDPDNPRNFPRVLFVWRSNLLGSSSKGHEYFLKHLLGVDGHVLADENHAWMPETIHMAKEAPKGKLDLLVDIDFRMTGTGVYSDIVLPAATWYEKYDLSSTDMHPFIHPFNPAISAPWETKSDWATFRTLSESFAKLAKEYLPAQEDLVMVPLNHDTPGEIAQPNGKVRDWKSGEIEATPGKTMPNFVVVRRDYPNIDEQMVTLGPLAEKSIGTKGISISGSKAYEEVAHQNGRAKLSGPGHNLPSIYAEQQVADAILLMSGATNGHRSMEQFKVLAKLTSNPEVERITAGREEEVLTLKEISVQPRSAMPTPVWSGLEGENTRYSPFTLNVQYDVPWHTLSGRQHFYLDHEMMLEFGEGLPLYRPPLTIAPFQQDDSRVPKSEGRSITVRYLTPHQKWGIHSTYADNPRMLTLFRGGQTIWLSEEDAEALGIKDNDWVEVYNRNGAIACRAVLTYRIPAGIAMMYHAQDRVIGVPGSDITKDRGGTHNSVTRVIPKPTHMIGGYAQLSAGFNYYGPTGHQRDALAFVRPLKEVKWLED